MPQGALGAKIESFGGHSYEFHMLDPITASDMLTDIQKILAPAIGAIWGGEQDESGTVSMDSGQLSKALSELMDRIDNKQKNEMMMKLAEKTYVDGTNLKSIFNVHFHGKIGQMYKWFFHALEAQFSDFFEELGIAFNPSESLAKVVGLKSQMG
jgi:hypothetical protein